MTKNIFPQFFNSEPEAGPEVGEYNRTGRNYIAFYRAVNEYLIKYPEIERRAHEDIKRLCKKNPSRERTPEFTTQNLFRAIIVMVLEGPLSFVGVEQAITFNWVLQDFCRLDRKPTISAQLICQASIALSPETWQNINHAFAIRMIDEGRITTDEVRFDGTVVESNIHWPTDSSLCYDCCRTIGRIVENARKAGLSRVLAGFRFHVPKIKALNFQINKYASAKSADRIKQCRRDYETIIERTENYIANAEKIVQLLKKNGSLKAMAFEAELSHYLPYMKKIADVARRRFRGEKVENEEKIFSLFEPHTELIQKGKKNKPIEFGHLIVVAQTREKFITDCVLTEVSPPESTMAPTILERHKEMYGSAPRGLAADKGFYPGKDKLEYLCDEYEGEVEYFGIPSRSNDFGDEEMRLYQRFRAGVEGTISFLKRCFGLTRVRFKGFNGFCRAVGLSVFCHNLTVMARQDLALE
jgi:IS5 family transposase